MVDAIATTTSPSSTPAPAARRGAATAQAGTAGTDASGKRKLTPGQEREVQELQDRDRAVRAHEAAHKAAGGSLASGATFSYQTGPDGKQYAVGGEVSIDMGRERDPHATVSKMQRVIAAALAPADPSGQDRTVAAEAQAIELQAQQEIAKQAVSGDQAGRAASAGGQPAGGTGQGSAVSRAYGQPAQASGSVLSLIA